MSTRLNRLERITNLVLALLDAPRPLSLREIGLAVAGYPAAPGALRQAFERDKRTLRDNGIPISVERVDGDDQVGYRILPEQYYLPDLGLTPEEEAALSFALPRCTSRAGPATRSSTSSAPRGQPTSPPSRSSRRSRRSGCSSRRSGTGRRWPSPTTGATAGFTATGSSSAAAAGTSSGGTPKRRTPGDCAASGSTGSRAIRSRAPPGATSVPEGFDAANELRFVPFQPNRDGPIEPEWTEVEITVDAREAAAVVALVGVGGGARPR